MRIILCSYLVSLLLACSEQSGTSPVAAVEALDPNTRLNFALRNEEIRGDVLRALIAEGIEHWINDDGSIGFYQRDAEAVDRIGYESIGAYAARN